VPDLFNDPEFVVGFVVVVCGIFGGFTSLMINKLRNPNLAFSPTYWVASMLIGGVAAWLFWALSAVVSEVPSVYAIAILCGIGGFTVIKNLYNNHLATQGRVELAKEVAEQIKSLDGLIVEIIQINQISDTELRMQKLDALAKFVQPIKDNNG
jgi:putative Mn2+ efflux pump MntP